MTTLRVEERLRRIEASVARLTNDPHWDGGVYVGSARETPEQLRQRRRDAVLSVLLRNRADIEDLLQAQSPPADSLLDEFITAAETGI